MDCPKCNKQFELPKRKAIVGVCGHSVCYDCAQPTWIRRSCFEPSCPVCKAKSAFRSLTKNNQLNDLIAEYEFSEKFVKLHELISKSLLKCHCCGTIVEEDKVRFCKTCSDENKGSVFDESGTVDRENLKESALCGSCFLDGLHKGHENVLWLPIKLRSKVSDLINNLRDAKNRVKSRLQEDFQNLMNSLDSVDQSLINLEENGKSPHTDAAHFKEIIETCKKEIEVCEGLETHLSTEFSEQITKVEETNEKLTGLSSVSKD